ncbi:MAG: hypothetical protein QXO25_01225 [Candidatus Bathyarchaeia archaeon]
MKSSEILHMMSLLVLLTIAQCVGAASAQKPEEITRGIPWFIGMIIVVIVVAVAAGLRQKKK